MHVFLHWLLKSEVVWKNISNSGRHRLHHICYNHQSKLDFRLMCLSCCSSTFKVAIFLNRTPQHSDQHTVNLLCTVLRLDCGYMTEKEDKCSTISKTKQRISRWREKRIITRLWSSPSALWSILASLSWLFWFLELLTVQSYLSSDHK